MNIIDRIEGNKIILIDDNKRIVEIPLDMVHGNFSEGDILKFDMSKKLYVTDVIQTEVYRNKIKKKMKNLWK